MIPEDKLRLRKLTGALALMLLFVVAAAGMGPDITPASLPNGDVSSFYSQTLIASETVLPPTCCTWKVAKGVLPGGLSLSSGTGASTTATISGTPTTAGKFSFSTIANDGLVDGPDRAYTITIKPALGIGPASLPSGEEGVSYAPKLTATGGTPGYTWSLTGALPSGVSFSNGAFSGKPGPGTAGSYPITVQVTDSVGGTFGQGYTVVIVSPPSVTTALLPVGEVGVPYPSTPLSATGGTAPYKWAITSGALPAGMTFSGGTLGGTPTAAGSGSITFQVTDAKGQTGSASLTLTVTAGPTITTPATLPNGEATAPYSQSLAASGGTPPYTWTVTSGSLPADLSLSAGGVISGTPATTGGYNFTVQVADSVNLKATQNFSLTIIAAPTITTSATLPQAEAGAAYSQTLIATGGSNAGFKWSMTGGSLPAGLSLSTGGVLSGIPTAAALGVSGFTVQVTDSVGNIGTQTLTMTVTTPVAQINQLLVPDSSAPGGAAFVLTLNGTGFGPGSKVLWNGSPRTTTFIGNRQLTAAISGSDVAALATASVSVSNPVTIFNKAVPNSNIDFFQITPTTSASLSRTDYPTGTKPNGLTAADFNGDGKLDLAIANSADNTVTILQGNGDGTFTAQPALATGAGSNPQLPTAGDFNGDGKLDLAVANFANNTVSVFLGNGDGTFQAPVTYPVGAGASSLVTGDFNRDGELDVAIGNQNDHTVSILLGNGDGTFQAHVDYPAGAPDVAGVALGDVNRDGKLDLVVANPSANTVSVLLGNGDGTFQAPVAYATGNHPVSLAVADLNGDGILDLAVTNLNARTVSILIGNGNGTFQAHMDFITTSGALIGPVAVATGDFNGDGKVDLAITNQTDNSVSILLGNGDGTFHAPLEFATGNVAAGVASGDFNGDGRLDVAVADFSANTVSVMLQRPEPASTLAVSNATASQVSLTWTASASTTVVGYNVYRGTTSGGPYTKVNLAIVAAPAFTDMSVASGTTYYYVVTAVDPGNLESINSNEVSATTPPQPPTSLAVTNVTASQVTLTWTASTTASVVSYNVYRSTISGVYKTPLASVNAGTSTYTDMTVAPGTTYYYVVTAVGPGNVQSVNSNEVSATTP